MAPACGRGFGIVLMAPGRGIQSIIEVLAFVFIIGGVFQIMAKDECADDRNPKNCP